eukprot:469708-Amorphochlora_amoeboformis.AAC.1
MQRLMDLGYTEQQCAEALEANDTNIEQAAEWLTLQATQASPREEEEEKVEGPIGRLMDLGYALAVCEAALREADDDIERAGEWLLAHADEWMQEHAQGNQEARSSSGCKKAVSDPFRKAKLDNTDARKAGKNAQMYCE